MIQLTSEPIDVTAVLDAARSPKAGAIVLFLGTAREFTARTFPAERHTRSLDYDAFRPMAEKKLAELAAEAQQQWGLTTCAVVHRLGHLAVGEVSVAIAVGSAHREAAFEAGRWLIDQIKQVVPIWKKETFDNGTDQWIHPDH